jgi:hypothetical protein
MILLLGALTEAVDVALPAEQGKSNIADKVHQRFRVGRFDRKSLFLPTDLPETFTFRVNYHGQSREIFLYRQSVRSGNYRLRAFRDGRYVELTPGPVRTYRGVVIDEPESAIAALLDEDGLSLNVYKGQKRQWSIKPLRKAVRTAQRDWHIVYDAEDEMPEPGVCGLHEMPEFPVDSGGEVPDTMDDHGSAQSISTWPSGQAVDPGDPLAAVVPGCKVYRAQVAFDTDHAFYNEMGSVTAVENRIDQIVNELTVIYARDAKTICELSGLIVRETPFWGWTIAGEDIYNYGGLTEFRAKWNDGSAGNGGFTYDFGHLVTGSNGGTGILGLAWVNTVCTSSRYAWSDNITGVIAHELGHNWGLGHCDGNGDCHIMCAYYGGCDGNPTFFGDDYSLWLKSRAAGTACINQVDPLASPSVPPRAFDDAAGSFIVDDLLGLGYLDIDVLVNDHDGNCDALTISGWSSPTPLGATLSVSGQMLRYTPPPGGAVGTDTFTYTCTDGNGGYDTATVTLYIEPSNLVGLVGHWTLDDGSGPIATDSSGNEFDGILGGSETWTNGIINGALSYPAEESETAATTNLGYVDRLSFSAWFNHAQTDSHQYFGRGLTGGDYEWRIYRYGGYGHIQIDTPGDSSPTWFTNITPTDNEWHHLVVTFNTTTFKIELYLDGIRRAQTFKTAMVPKTRNQLDWGAGINGLMDDVRVYDYVLTEQQVETLYAMGVPVASDPWPADEAAGVAQNAVLSWIPADGFNPAVDTHKVYLGPSQASMTLVGTVSDPAFDPALEWSSPYYWRVDEVMGGTTYSGLVWTFTTTGERLCDPPLIADINDDCVVDMTDLAQMAADWLACTHISGSCH